MRIFKDFFKTNAFYYGLKFLPCACRINFISSCFQSSSENRNFTAAVGSNCHRLFSTHRKLNTFDANENTDGPFRQYFLKGADLSIYPEDYLDAVAKELNDRPRKTLGWRKPSEVFLGLIYDSLIT